MPFRISHRVTSKSKPSLLFSYKTGSLSQGRVCKSQNDVGAPMWATYNLTAITCHYHDFSLGVPLPLTIVFVPPSLQGAQEILLNSGSWITIFSVNDDWLSLLQISLHFWSWYTQHALHVRTEPISTSPSFRRWGDRSTSLHRLTLLTSCGPKQKHSHLLPVPSMSLNSVFTQQVIMGMKRCFLKSSSVSWPLLSYFRLKPSIRRYRSGSFLTPPMLPDGSKWNPSEYHHICILKVVNVSPHLSNALSTQICTPLGACLFTLISSLAMWRAPVILDRHSDGTGLARAQVVFFLPPPSFLPSFLFHRLICSQDLELLV